LTEVYGGTGRSSYTLGDVLYSDAADSIAKLAGNTVATKKFLTQIGDGSVSAAPAWNVIVDGDILESSVTQHQAALTILESQITDGSILVRLADTNWVDLTDGGGTTLHTHALNNITNPTGNKTFNMTTRQLGFLWTNPSGNPMEFEVSGAYSGAVLHIHQHTGNPGANTYLVTLESEDVDVHQVVSIGPATTTEVYCTDVSGDTEHRFFIRSDGQMEWGPGNAGQDTNLYRSASDTLKTDDAFEATGGFTGALTGNASTATTLETPRDINGVSFDGSANITVTAAAGTLTGTTLKSTVVTSSLTAIGTLSSGAVPASLVTAGTFGTGAYVFDNTVQMAGL
ncbi:hypothetical protein LCGC14_3125390, partial [marine sediment metagenome]